MITEALQDGPHVKPFCVHLYKTNKKLDKSLRVRERDLGKRFPIRDWKFYSVEA